MTRPKSAKSKSPKTAKRAGRKTSGKSPNSSNSSAAATKPKRLTTKEEAFTENYCANGFNATQAAADAGYKGNRATLAQVGYENLRKPEIPSRVRTRLDGLHASADEVLNLLADHLRADLADFQGCFDDEGGLDLDKAKEKGVSRLVRKIRSVTRMIPRGKDEEPIRETTVEIELYSAQDAAAKLILALGLKQRPRENEADAERRRTWAEEKLKIVMTRLNLGRPAALAWLRENAPARSGSTRDTAGKLWACCPIARSQKYVEVLCAISSRRSPHTTASPSNGIQRIWD